MLITDLDDTIWDWLKIWHTSFDALFARLLNGAGLSEEKLISEIRKIHQEVGTSEYYFLPQHLEINQGRSPKTSEILQRYGDIISLFATAQREGATLLPGVIDTFKIARENGTKIIAYTESMAFGAVQRIKATKLDGVIDILYSREDHFIPEPIKLDNIRSNSGEQYNLVKTKHIKHPRHVMKPNPEVLREIVQGLGAVPKQCVYVGDKLLKDIKMAQDANILDVYARYGDNRDNSMYERLKQVTHWSETEVQDEVKATTKEVAASITLKEKYSDILEEIDFVGFK